ncbi:type II secretion system minor pseudopilin GspK [Ramlibacter sp. PS3R-8]|uniref:type II secretion system minor pseudopilin GspK n=1 Tax=Ramlibacter sp. PS3R-8 TaxID=3133437 RepID=UPI0030A26230
MTRRAHRGAALLAAMLTVTLVATFAAASVWHQWRSAEVEGADRMRVQSGWILGGALDWARLILREDARAGNADHLAEPWAVPLQEARLATFLAADRNVSVEGSDSANIFLSGQIADLQAKLNVTSLLQAGTQSQLQREVFNRLFDALGLPRQQLETMAANLQFAADLSTENLSAKRAPLMPNRLEQLQWLGLAPETIAALEPHVTVLPVRTLLNLNTASAEAIYAAGQGIDMADAQKLVAVRQAQYFRSVNEAAALTKAPTAFANTAGVSSQFFEVRGRLRIDNVVIEERSVVQRTGLDIRIVTRERGAAESPPQATARK